MLGLCLVLIKSCFGQSVGNCTSHVVVGSATTDAGDGGPSLEAQFFGPSGLAKDSGGNLYIADSGNNKIRVVGSNGIVETFAGTGVPGDSGDNGPATAAQLNDPVAVAIGPQGEVYIVEAGGNRVRKVASDGDIVTVAGNGQGGFGGDGGPATQARLSNPHGIAFDSQGNIYISDTDNYRVRRVAKDGTIATYAGSGPQGSQTGDGQPAVTGNVVSPGDLAFGANGTLYIAAYNSLESVTPDGLLHILGGANGNNPPADGAVATQVFLSVRNIALDSQGNLLFVQSAYNYTIFDTVYQLGADGILHYVAETDMGAGLLLPPDGTIVRGVDGTIVQYTPAPFSATAPNPSVTIAGVSPAGNSGDGGPGTSARLFSPRGMASDAAGNLPIVDAGAGRIRKLDTKGIITTVAGSGGSGTTPDGLPALQTILNYPVAIAVSQSGEIYYAEPYDDHVRKIGANGTVTTVAGNGQYPQGYRGRFDGRDGANATQAALRPDAIAVDGQGNLYISDGTSGVIWNVTADGMLHALVVLGFTGVAAPLAADPTGTVYYLNTREAYNPSLVHLASGSQPQVVRYIGGYVSQPSFFAIDGAGNVYLADYGFPILKSSAQGAVTVLTNTAAPAPWAAIASLALDGSGNLFAADDDLSRIVELPSATGCTASVLPLIPEPGPVSAANYVGLVAPGELVAIFGTVVGPAQPAGLAVDANGMLATSIGQTQVLFDGVPAPMVYASPGQTMAIVPFGVAGQIYTNLQVSVNGYLSNAVPVQLTESQPGIFTQNASGSGPGAILNQDYSVNSVANPAAAGSVVMVYATGLGLLNPPLPDGEIAGASLSYCVQTVTATIDGVAAPVLYAGTAPGLVTGVYQVNIQLPNDSSGNASLVILQGEWPTPYYSQAHVTVAIQ